jgi:hypothetical protein
MRPHALLIAVVTLALGTACATAVAAEGWELLGTRNAGHGADRDEIVVTAAEGRFRQVKLTVSRSALELRDLDVHYADGTVQEVAVRRLIPAGGETRAIDLDGGDRVIRKVVFRYATPRRRARTAVVRLYGR